MTIAAQDIARLEAWCDIYAEILEDWGAALRAWAPTEPHWRRLLESVDIAFECELKIIALESERVAGILGEFRERTV